MNVPGVQFIINEANKLASCVIRLTKNAIKTCLYYQYRAAIFPFLFAYGGTVYVLKGFNNTDNENITPQPSNKDVLTKAKQLRNSAVDSMKAVSQSKSHNEKNGSKEDECEKQLGHPDLNVEDKFSMGNSNRNVSSIKLNEFSGSDLLWDIPLISSKAKYFAQCVKEERDDDKMEARKALEQHPLEIQMPKTRREFNDMKNKAENKHKNSKSSIIKFDYTETKNADNCNDSDSFEENYREKREFRSYHASSLSQKSKIKCLYNPLLTQDKIMYREISTVNKTLRKIQATCSRLLGELSNLNEALTKVISMKEKLSNLEFQVDEGKRLLQEVECDRFIMKSKLSALEKLINEEEKFLSGDVFCESGFYDSIDTTGEF